MEQNYKIHPGPDPRAIVLDSVKMVTRQHLVSL